MEKIIQSALTANAASMGLNWIYNIPYLDRLAKEGDLLFTAVDPAKYKRARKAYMAYPKAQIGDASLQGMILKWTYQALKDNPDLSHDDYKQLITDKIAPGSDYIGWVESYGKKLLFNRFIKELELDQEPLVLDDDQLIGFIPYIACKALNLPREKALELTSVFTNEPHYADFFTVFDALTENLKTMTMSEALRASLADVPKDFGFKLTMALNAKEPKDVLNVVNTSCAIGYAIPLMYTILDHTKTYEEALTLNTQFGGASCDRGTLIGALLSHLDISEDLLNKTNLTL